MITKRGTSHHGALLTEPEERMLHGIVNEFDPATATVEAVEQRVARLGGADRRREIAADFVCEALEFKGWCASLGA